MIASWEEERRYCDGMPELYHVTAEETPQGWCFSERSGFEVRWHSIKSTRGLKGRALKAARHSREARGPLRLVVRVPPSCMPSVHARNHLYPGCRKAEEDAAEDADPGPAEAQANLR